MNIIKINRNKTSVKYYFKSMCRPLLWTKWYFLPSRESWAFYLEEWGTTSAKERIAWDVWQRHHYLDMVVVEDGDFFVERSTVGLVEAWRRRKWLNGKTGREESFWKEGAEKKMVVGNKVSTSWEERRTRK